MLALDGVLVDLQGRPVPKLDLPAPPILANTPPATWSWLVEGMTVILPRIDRTAGRKDLRYRVLAIRPHKGMASRWAVTLERLDGPTRKTPKIVDISHVEIAPPCPS